MQNSVVGKTFCHKTSFIELLITQREMKLMMMITMMVWNSDDDGEKWTDKRLRYDVKTKPRKTTTITITNQNERKTMFFCQKSF